MFADPQSVTINAVPTSLPRTQTEATKSVYSAADESVVMTISHQETSSGRTRHIVRLDKRVVATDPLEATKQTYETLGTYAVIDEPEYGFSDTDINYMVQALCDWLTAGNVAKVCGAEH